MCCVDARECCGDLSQECVAGTWVESVRAPENPCLCIFTHQDLLCGLELCVVWVWVVCCLDLSCVDLGFEYVVWDLGFEYVVWTWEGWGVWVCCDLCGLSMWVCCFRMVLWWRPEQQRKWMLVRRWHLAPPPSSSLHRPTVDNSSLLLVSDHGLSFGSSLAPSTSPLLTYHHPACSPPPPPHTHTHLDRSSSLHKPTVDNSSLLLQY